MIDKIPGAKIIEKSQAAPDEQVIKGWSWRRVAEAIVERYCEIRPDLEYKWAYGSWIIAKPKPTQPNPNQNPSDPEPSIVIPLRFIKNIELREG